MNIETENLAAPSADPPVTPYNRLMSIFSMSATRFIGMPIDVPLDPNMLSPTTSNLNFVKSLVKNRIGSQSMQGSVYMIELPGSNFVLKKSECPNTDAEGQASCDRLAHKTLYQTPMGPGRDAVSLPSFILESIVANLLNRNDSYAPHFPINYGVTWGVAENIGPDADKSYSLMERLSGEAFDKVISGQTFMVLLAQYLYALSVAQQMNKFTHNDSHFGNIMYMDTPGPENTTVWNQLIIKSFSAANSLPNSPAMSSTYWMKNPGWTLKLIDFGISRAETATRAFYGTMFGAAAQHRLFGKFSHCIDYLKLIGKALNPFYDRVNGSEDRRIFNVITGSPRLKELARRTGFMGPPNKAVPYLFYNAICPGLVNSGNSDDVNDAVIKYIYGGDGNNFRPQPEAVFSRHAMFSTPDTVLINFVLPWLINTGNATANNPAELSRTVIREVTNYTPLFNNRPYNKNFITEQTPSTPILSIISGPYTGNPIMMYSNLFAKVVEPYKYKRFYNMSDATNIPCNTELIQYAHVVSINLSLMAISGLKIVSECCGMDVSEYLEENGRYGVAMNGVFFDWFKSNRPMGTFKNASGVLDTNPPVPQLDPKYHPYYAYIAMGNPTSTSQGYVSIGPYANLNATVVNNSEMVAVSGPLLISGGKVVVDDTMINAVSGGERIFECYRQKIPANTQITACDGQGHDTRVTTLYSHPDCGQFHVHASNLNPRSALAYSATEKTLHFISIEGRERRGKGMDMIMLANFIMKQLPNISEAVNLDGGRSSTIAWKTPRDPNTITAINPNNASVYPVGNIFAIVNK